MSQQTRRSFLKKSAAVGIGATVFGGPAVSFGRVIGANDRVRMAIAGVKGRGKNHIDGYAKIKGVEITTVVDPDTRLFAEASARVKRRFGVKPKCVQDVRKALEDKSIDAITIATPNHWHSLMTIWACQHGKHVYVEKPCSQNVHEGRKAVEAAEKYKVLVQHGTQQRSNQGRANEIAAVHSGKYGKLLVSKGNASKARWTIGFKPVKTPPKELDYDLWVGPAEKVPYHENLVHYNWHWFWNTGCGEIGNQGVHQMDVARWAIKDGTLPTRVWSLGGRWVNEPGYKDQAETPNMLLSVFEFGDALLIFESRGLVQKKASFSKGLLPRCLTNEYYTTEGRICDGKFYPKDGGKPEQIKFRGPQLVKGGTFGSFIATLRDGDFSRCNATILNGHYSSALCHLGNISYRLGKQRPFGEKPAHMGDNAQVAASFDNILENLKIAGFELDDKTYQVGAVLDFDPAAEKFVGNEKANALLTRPPRKPYDVPEQV